mgnify:CR=1 FL=1
MPSRDAYWLAQNAVKRGSSLHYRLNFSFVTQVYRLRLAVNDYHQPLEWAEYMSGPL